MAWNCFGDLIPAKILMNLEREYSSRAEGVNIVGGVIIDRIDTRKLMYKKC